MTNTQNYGLNVVQTTDRILADVEAIGENAESIDKLCNGTLEGETITTTFGNTRLGDWEIYGQATQNGTPTPSSPVAVNVVTGDNTVVVHGLNWIDRTACTEDKGLSWTAGTQYALTDGLTTDYIKIADGMEFSTNWNGCIFFYDNSKTYLGCLQIGGTTIAKATGTKFTNFTIPANYGVKYMRITYRPTDNNNTVMTAQNIQLQQGSTASVFTPYAQTQLLQLGSLELAKIGDYADYIYRSGSKWFKHSVIGKYTFTGTEAGWNLSTGTGRYSFWIRKNLLSPSGVGNNSVSMCNRFAYTSTVYTSAPIPSLCENSQPTTSMFIFNTDGTQGTTIDAWKTWLQSNSTTLYYILATATDTEITNATLIGQLNNLCKLKTSTGTSTGTSTIQVSTSNATPSKLKVYLYNEAQSKLIDRLDSLEARVTILE